MAQRILIDPVTRIEGHAKITVQLDDAGQTSDAHFQIPRRACEEVLRRAAKRSPRRCSPP
jgi:F420-non-reducing hydrogenase large subunit